MYQRNQLKRGKQQTKKTPQIIENAVSTALKLCFFIFTISTNGTYLLLQAEDGVIPRMYTPDENKSAERTSIRRGRIRGYHYEML